MASGEANPQFDASAFRVVPFGDLRGHTLEPGDLVTDIWRASKFDGVERAICLQLHPIHRVRANDEEAITRHESDILADWPPDGINRISNFLQPRGYHGQLYLGSVAIIPFDSERAMTHTNGGRHLRSSASNRNYPIADRPGLGAVYMGACRIGGWYSFAVETSYSLKRPLGPRSLNDQNLVRRTMTSSGQIAQLEAIVDEREQASAATAHAAAVFALQNVFQGGTASGRRRYLPMPPGRHRPTT